MKLKYARKAKISPFLSTKSDDLHHKWMLKQMIYMHIFAQFCIKWLWNRYSFALINCIDRQWPIRYFPHWSRVPVPIHVHKSEIVDNLAPDFIEPSMGFMIVLDEISVSAIAERSIRWVLAVAHLVVSTLTDIELHGSASGNIGIASSVTPWPVQRKSTGAPTVNLSLLQVGVVGEPTWRSISIPVMKGILGGLYFPSL